MTYALSYVSTLVIFLLLDLVWLGIVARGVYRAQLAGLMADRFNLWAATAFYLIYPLGVVIFAVLPPHASASASDTAIRGAMLGFFAYATYDLTNLATLRAWPWRLSLLDILWGTVLTAIAATSAQLIARGSTL